MDNPVQANPSDSEQDESTDFEEDDESEPGSPHEVGSLSDVKKRRKKKKKKKKKNAVAAGEANLAPVSSSSSKAENDRRFAAALDRLQKDDSDSIWTRLDQCYIFDGKTRRIAEALRNNRQVTSLDLSGNGIGDEGAQALYSVLESGAAPELILLDLRGNHISESGMEVLRSLQSTRRQLKVELKQLQSVGTNAPNSDEDAAEVIVKEDVEQSSPKFQDAAAESLFMQKFFQGGNGGWEGAKQAADEPTEPIEDPEVATARIWEEVNKELNRSEPSINALSSSLRELAEGVSREMAAGAPLPPSTRLDDLKPFSRTAISCLSKLHAVLDIVPPPRVAQHSKHTPLAALGSHRAAAAQVVQRLMLGMSGAINIHIVKAALIPRLVALCFEHPYNDVLHAACIFIIRSSLESGLRALWDPLFRPQMGLSGKQQLPLSWPGPFLQLLVREAQAGAASPSISRRPCSMGLAVSLAQQFFEASQDDSTIAHHLQKDDEWMEFAKPGGLLGTLLAEQSGDLCGPRPEKNAMHVQSEDEGAGQGEYSGGKLLNGPDLLAMLASTMNGLQLQNGSKDMG